MVARPCRALSVRCSGQRAGSVAHARFPGLRVHVQHLNDICAQVVAEWEGLPVRALPPARPSLLPPPVVFCVAVGQRPEEEQGFTARILRAETEARRRGGVQHQPGVHDAHPSQCHFPLRCRQISPARAVNVGLRQRWRQRRAGVGAGRATARAVRIIARASANLHAAM